MRSINQRATYALSVADRIDILVADAHQADMGHLAVTLAQFSGLVRAMNVPAPASAMESSAISSQKISCDEMVFQS